MGRTLEYGTVKLDVSRKLKVPKNVVEKFEFKPGKSRFKIVVDEETGIIKYIPLKKIKGITVTGEEIELVDYEEGENNDASEV